MKTYISDIIPKIQKFSQKLDNLTLLTNQHWVVIDNVENEKNVYIFRQNNELLISQNGKVEKAKWEYLGHNSLLIDRKDESYLFKHGFFDENILALKIDSKNEYAFLVNENKFDKELNSLESIIEFLNKKYVASTIRKNIQNTTGFIIETDEQNDKDIDYTAPEYKIVNQTEESSLFGGITDKYLIEFSDGEKGEVYVVRNNKQAHFKGKPEGYWINLKYVYMDFESCINAIHYFNKNRSELKTGFIHSF